MSYELEQRGWQRAVDNLLNGNWKIRKLTPKECFRLQGISDEMFERAESVNSDSQLYKQAGNSCTVQVVYEIAKKLETSVCDTKEEGEEK